MDIHLYLHDVPADELVLKALKLLTDRVEEINKRLSDPEALRAAVVSLTEQDKLLKEAVEASNFPTASSSNAKS